LVVLTEGVWGMERDRLNDSVAESDELRLD
jgi:hypothetical protein